MKATRSILLPRQNGFLNTLAFQWYQCAIATFLIPILKKWLFAWRTDLKVDDGRDESHDYLINRKIESNNRLRPQQIRYKHYRNTNYPRNRQGYDVGQTRPNYINTRYGYSRVTNREGNYPRFVLSEGNSYGCYNCGEFNHREANCRFDHKIKCNVCYEYGHKSRLCKQNIQY